MKRNHTINHAIQKHGYKSYLEIGCFKNVCFNDVKCNYKVGVDSVEGGTVRMTSDDFFLQNKETFDIIFIDAYHHHDFVMRDVRNSLKVLNTGGRIVMHDCSPHNERFELLDACGTTWRAFVHLRCDPDLEMIVGDYDFGVGVIKVQSNTDPLTISKSMDELTYNDLESNRSRWLRLTSWSDVQKWILTIYTAHRPPHDPMKCVIHRNPMDIKEEGTMSPKRVWQRYSFEGQTLEIADHYGRCGECGGTTLARLAENEDGTEHWWHAPHSCRYSVRISTFRRLVYEEDLAYFQSKLRRAFNLDLRKN